MKNVKMVVLAILLGLTAAIIVLICCNDKDDPEPPTTTITETETESETETKFIPSPDASYAQKLAEEATRIKGE